MAKVTYKAVSKKDFFNTLAGCKLLSNSLESPKTIIRQFNALTCSERMEIIKEQTLLEKKLQAAITNSDENLYLSCGMVNLHIIATKYNIDPATVCLCISKLCKNNEKLLVK